MPKIPTLLSTSISLHVYVPTRGRINTQTTMKMMELQRLQGEGVFTLKFVIPEYDKPLFSKTYPWTANFICTVPDSYRYGDVIQHIASKLPGKYKVVIDDDMSLLRRRNPMSISQKGGVATSQDLNDLFERVKSHLTRYKHGGISLRQVNHFCKDAWFKEDTRVNGMFFFDADVLNGEGVRFDAVQERSDFHVTLSLLELGYHNICDYEFAVGQYLTKTNSPGGCSRYRSPEFLLKQAELLQELHPQSVKVIFKDGSAKEYDSMRMPDGTIPDVRIQWARSFGVRLKDRKLP